MNQVDGSIVGFSEPENIIITDHIDARYLPCASAGLSICLPVCRLTVCVSATMLMNLVALLQKQSGTQKDAAVYNQKSAPYGAS